MLPTLEQINSAFCPEIVVTCDFYNGQPLFPYTALKDFSFNEDEFCAGF
jgi:hypothetical protein